MKRDIQVIQDEADETMKVFAKRDAQNKEMDRMAASQWTLPRDVDKDFIRETVSPAPANALTTSVKVLGAETPKIKFTPTGPHPDDRATASKIERGLTWELKSAALRSQTKLVPDIIRSALQYAETAVYIDYLPWRLKGQVSSKRMKRIMGMGGNFAVIPHNPSTVYPRHSPLGLESVLLAKKMSAYELIKYWGDRSKDLQNYIKSERDGKDIEVKYYDYTDDSQRAVWCTLAETSAKDRWVFLDEERNRSFIPWSVRIHGTALESTPDLQRIPFLSTVYRANMWRTMNLVNTLLTSEVLSYAAAPRGKKMGPNPGSIQVDYGDAGKSVEVGAGQDYIPLAPPVIDRALTEIYDRMKADLDAATSVQVLQNLNFPAGTAYATVNAVLQTAISSLQPYKVLSEMALADVFQMMLLWIDETNGEIAAYGTGKEDSGEQYSVTKEDFSTDAIYISVELNASAPTDFMQRINAGTLMYQLGYPKGRVFEDLNVPDPEQVISERYQEDLVNNEMTIAIQQRQQEAALEAAMQAQALQPQQPPPQQNMQNMQQGPPPSPGFENIEGQGFDPNLGGTPPPLGASGLTREELTGVTAGGDPLAEI